MDYNITTIIAVLAFILACISLALEWYFQIYRPERVAIQFVPKWSRHKKISRGNKFSGTIRIRNKAAEYDTSITSIIFDPNNVNVKMTKLRDSENDYLTNQVISLPRGILKIINYGIECENPPALCKNAMFIFDIPARKRGVLTKKITLHFL